MSLMTQWSMEGHVLTSTGDKGVERQGWLAEAYSKSQGPVTSNVLCVPIPSQYVCGRGHRGQQTSRGHGNEGPCGVGRMSYVRFISILIPLPLCLTLELLVTPPPNSASCPWTAHAGARRAVRGGVGCPFLGLSHDSLVVTPFAGAAEGPLRADFQRVPGSNLVYYPVCSV